MRKFTFALSMIMMLLSFNITVTANESAVPISIFINDQLILTDSDPVILNSTTFVPIRFIAEAFAVEKILWNEEEESVVMLSGDKNIKFYINQSVAYINDEEYQLEAAPIILNNRSMVPIRFIAENLDCVVEWDSYTSSVLITKELESSEVYLPAEGNNYSQEDILWLSRIVHVEAFDLSPEGKLAIANVVINRMDSPIFPNTIYGVIFDNSYTVQFPPAYKNGFTDIVPTDEDVIAAKSALNGQNNIDECLYFNNMPFSWKSSEELYIVIDGEYFYY
jgi:hypothetical protein